MTNNLHKNFSLYLIILFCFGAFFLNEKHIVDNDSTISEWLINYSGGFTKRGLIGEICVFFANLFEIGLRDSILSFQLIIFLTYFLLIYFFFKDIKMNKLMIFAVFSPIFVLYPVAEIEVLARKELFIFCIFITYLNIKNNLNRIIYKLILLPIAILIWEPLIFFFPFWLAIDVIENKIKNFNKIFFKNLISLLPALLVAIYIILNPITVENWGIMSQFLKNEFGEVCYMSCGLLKEKSTIYQQFKGNFHKYSFEVFFRYFLIILIGFGPLFILSFSSSLNEKKIVLFKKYNHILIPLLILLSPVILLFAMGYDWGRWVNISYFFAVIFYFYLVKKDLIKVNENIFNKITIFLKPKKIFITVFILYCFSWNPKTVISGDVASFPGYRIPYKTFKIINNKYLKQTNFKIYYKKIF